MIIILTLKTPRRRLAVGALGVLSMIQQQQDNAYVYHTQLI